MPTEGLEPPHLAAHGPEPCASTNSATWACKTSNVQQQQGSFWCPRRDSNPHTSRHMDLNHARLPIPPRGQSTATTLVSARARGAHPTQMLASWCPRRDSNPHTSRHMDLNHARLPIPPRGHWTALLALLDVAVEFRYDIRLCHFALDQLSFVLSAHRLCSVFVFRLGRFRRDRKYSGWMANVKGPPSRTLPARFAGDVRRIRRSSVTLRVPTCQCNDIRAVRQMDGATTEKIRIPI